MLHIHPGQIIVTHCGIQFNRLDAGGMASDSVSYPQASFHSSPWRRNKGNGMDLGSTSINAGVIHVVSFFILVIFILRYQNIKSPVAYLWCHSNVVTLMIYVCAEYCWLIRRRWDHVYEKCKYKERTSNKKKNTSSLRGENSTKLKTSGVICIYVICIVKLSN